MLCSLGCSVVMSCLRTLQRKALERMAQLEEDNARMAADAQRRSANLQQSRAFIRSYLEVPVCAAGNSCN
jgi:hypothetical protein